MTLAILLDRDGTLTQRPGVLLHPKMVRLLPGVPEALARATKAGVKLAVVTNQPLGSTLLLTPERLERVHAELRQQLQAAGARLDVVLACTHMSAAGCACRKPQPGLLQRAMRELGATHAWMVGDTWRDVEAARAAGVPAALVTWQHGWPWPKPGRHDADLVVRSTPEAVDHILQKWGLDDPVEPRRR